MKILFTICGRAGSKGIKNKNVRTFLGYPLPYYTFAVIDLYIKKYTVDDIDIAVNTDSLDLLNISSDNPFIKVNLIKRDVKLGGDRVPKTAVILDTMLQMEYKCGANYDMVVDLDLTSPLRTPEDIRNLIEKQKEKKCDVVFSVTEARRNPYFNMVIDGERGVHKIIESDFVARQQAPNVYDMNASLYAYSPVYLRTCKGVLDGYCEIIKMMDTGILDLDHENDFELMEVIAKYLYENKEDFMNVFKQINCVSKRYGINVDE